MDYKEEIDIFEQYLKQNGLKYSKQRVDIMAIFLAGEHHMTAEDLYRAVNRVNSKIGIATIYRTLNLLCKSGLCREIKLDDGVSRYEHLHDHAHHDHLICLSCRKLIEVYSPGIEELQEHLAKENGFQLKYHKLEMYGVCKSCRSDPI